MEHIEYKNFLEGKYPKPEDRMRKASFPDESELFTYGVDFPMPESMDDLRAEYREDERFPLVLTELEGYKVPPFGLTVVSASGSGHKQGIIYVPGTFRESRTQFGKDYGMTPQSAVAIREDNKVIAMVAGIKEAFDEKGIEINGHSKEAVLGALVKQATLKVIDEPSAREAIKITEMMYKILGLKEESKERREGKVLDLAGAAVGTVQTVLKLTEEVARLTKLLEQYQRGEIVQGEFTPLED